MKQKLDTRQYFDNLDEDSKFALLYETQLRVQRLERVAQDLVVWGEWSTYYKEARKELENYFKGE